MKNYLASDRLSYVETIVMRPSIVIGAVRCVYINAWMTHDLRPSVVDLSALIVEVRSSWLLSGLLIDDGSRRKGLATEFLRFYEDRLGSFGACWASASGVAFAKRYIERHGPRPGWKLVPPDECVGEVERVTSL